MKHPMRNANASRHALFIKPIYRRRASNRGFFYGVSGARIVRADWGLRPIRPDCRFARLDPAEPGNKSFPASASVNRKRLYMRNPGSRRMVGALSGVLLAACVTACVESGKEPERLQGLVRNTCGPTDGPAVEVVIRKAGMGGCADTGAIEARLSLDWLQVDSLAPGKTFLDSLGDCGTFSCQMRSFYRLQIESADTKSVQATLETREKETNGGETVKRVEVDLTKCPKVIGFCG